MKVIGKSIVMDVLGVFLICLGWAIGQTGLVIAGTVALSGAIVADSILESRKQ